MTEVHSVFFNRLVTTVPNPKKLELQRYNDFRGRLDTKDLIPISSSTKLEHAIIIKFKQMNAFHFEEMCRNFHNIISLKKSVDSREVR